jgi:hypothetical protein
VVAVLERRVPAPRPVLVVVALGPVVHGPARAGEERRTDAREEEGTDGEQDDRAPGRRLGVVRDDHAADAAPHADRHRPPHRRTEASREELRRRVRQDHQGADEEQPDDPHRHDHGHGGEHREDDVVAEHRQPLRPRVLLVVGHGEEARPQEERRPEDHGGEQGEDDDVARRRREDRPEQVAGERRGRPGAGPGDEDDAEGDPAVGDVGHAVADERHPALDEEDADEGRRETGEERSEQRLAHEVEGEEVVHRVTDRGAGSSGAAPMTWPEPAARSSGWWWPEPAECPATWAA